MRQPQWNIYEAVILLYGFLLYKSGKVTREKVISGVSKYLRRMAKNNGLEIDDVYRNENGISFQLESMESAYEGKRISIPTTKLFADVVDIHNNDPQKYIELLQEAQRMGEENNITNNDQITNRQTQRSDEIIASLKSILKKESSRNRYGTTLKFLYKSLLKDTSLRGINIRQTDVKCILDDAPWAVYRFHRYYFVKIPENVMQEKEEIYAINFNNIPQLVHTKPISFSYFGEVKGDLRSWEDLYIYLISTLADDYPHILKAGISFSENGQGQIAIGNIDVAKNMMSPKKLTLETGESLYLETNLSAHNIVRMIRNALGLCLVDYENVEIYYINEHDQKKLDFTVGFGAKFGETSKNEDVSSRNSGKNQSAVPANSNSEITDVLRQHYKYGFKYNSIREFMRFRQFANAMGITLPEEDEALKASILSSGTVIGDKVYCKSYDMLHELQRIIDDILFSGVNVIYFESLYEDKLEWMEAHVITSPDMLKEYLQNNIEGCFFSKKFMGKGSKRSEKQAVTGELKRIWGEHPVDSVDELSRRLPYIPLENIWRVISGNDIFVRTAEGEYLFIDRFHITEDEEEDILDFVDAACEEKGFASLSDVPLGDIKEENYELEQPAIYNAIYKKVLLGKYYLNEKILTKGNSELDVVMLLKQYIKDKDECTFDEVADKVVELTGGINRQYAFQALYDDMVRVDKNRFVANRFVSFSIDEIDTVLAGFITDNFRAIRDVSTFAMFPLCGQNWNHYLLESFCYKYSRKYSLHVIHFNGKNAGIIAEKDFSKEYNEMLAIAIARTDVELSPEVIGQYLFNTGYTAKSKYAKLGEISQRASELRKDR